MITHDISELLLFIHLDSLFHIYPELGAVLTAVLIRGKFGFWVVIFLSKVVHAHCAGCCTALCSFIKNRQQWPVVVRNIIMRCRPIRKVSTFCLSGT